ncbi:unnamed protein product [Ilex paraguariensis]|uniref:Disease resistance protein Roq1-like winged-helix domain-containing protein n=1 Tax=Ilex paraguariensis TaxID=185542 RepID=A0ABC8RNT2_9AQUA
MLFNLHAFGQDEPVEGHVEQSRKVPHCCGGMPLVLEVMGSCLSGKSVDEWESALKRIEVIPNYEFLQVLKISYDSLPDIHYKNLFLDIECFFVGKDKDYVITILDGCGYATIDGLRTLMDRFLLTANKKLEMHQLLQDMGREIICQKSYDETRKTQQTVVS